MYQKPKSSFLPWLVVVLILVVILGTAYWYYMNFVQPTGVSSLNPSPSPTIVPSSSLTIDVSPSGLAYTNADYRFNLTFPETWQGFTVKKSPNAGTTAFYTVDLPSTDPSAPSGVYEAFYLYVYTPAEWSTVQKAEGPKPTLINQSGQHVFAYGLNTGSPTSDWKDKTTITPDYITSSVISTFQFVQ